MARCWSKGSLGFPAAPLRSWRKNVRSRGRGVQVCGVEPSACGVLVCRGDVVLSLVFVGVAAHPYAVLIIAVFPSWSWAAMW